MARAREVGHIRRAQSGRIAAETLSGAGVQMNMRNLLVVMSFSALAACGGGVRRCSACDREFQPFGSVAPGSARRPRWTSGRCSPAAYPHGRVPRPDSTSKFAANVVGTLSTRHLKNTDRRGPAGHQRHLRGSAPTTWRRPSTGQSARPPGRASIRISSKCAATRTCSKWCACRAPT